MRECFLTLIVTILACTSSFAQDYSKMEASQVNVLKSWLAKQPGWRLANINDYDKEIVKFGIEEEGKDFAPFYAAADLNYDQRIDFAVVLVSTGKKRSYAAAIFNAPFDGSAGQKPAFFVPNLQKGDGVFFKNKLLIGPYASDNILIISPVCLTYRIDVPEFGDQ